MTDETDHRSDARATLLRALEQLDEVEQEFGEAKRTMLCVVWAHQVEGKTIRGWNATDEPDFVTVALLREVGDFIEAPDEEDEDEEE